jgi:membrane-associated protease RseP (regulator of RpoE activity)
MDCPVKPHPQAQPRKKLDYIVYVLVFCAVVLGGIAAFRHAPAKRNLNQLQTAGFEDPLSNFQANGNSLLPMPSQQVPFICQQCQSCCWAAGCLGAPVCPFCGRNMARPAWDAMQAGIDYNYGPGAWPNSALAQGTPDASSSPSRRGMLIREFGLEAGSAANGARVTGVMGNSYAANAGVRTGDVILECNGTKVRGAASLQQIVAQLTPETDVLLKIRRNNALKKLSITVGEGEMEGFTPLPQP